MANKFTGITSAGVNVPVYDKEAHQALGNVYTKSEVDTELNTKQDKLTAGSNIKIENNTISVTGGIGKIYTGVGTISVDNTSNQISIDDSGYAKLEDMPNVFIGEYGVTTFDEITQALADNKAIFIINCPWGAGSGKRQAHFAGTNVDGYFFENTEITLNVSDPRIVRYWLNQSNTWRYSVIWSTSTNETYVKSVVNSAVSGKQDNLSTEQLYNIDNALTTSAGLASEAWVNNQGFAKESDIPTTAGLMEESKLSINSNHITAYNGIPFSAQGGGGGGATYEGVAPIIVDNTENKISADTIDVNYQQIVHDDSLVHVSNDAQYALGVNTRMFKDETILWEGNLTPPNKTVTLSENYTNFEKIAVEWAWNSSVGHRKISYFTSDQYNIGDSCASLAGTSTTDIYMGLFFGKLSNENQLTLNLTKQIQISTTSLSVINNQTLGAIYKVIGIGRKGGV